MKTEPVSSTLPHRTAELGDWIARGHVEESTVPPSHSLQELIRRLRAFERSITLEELRHSLSDLKFTSADLAAYIVFADNDSHDCQIEFTEHFEIRCLSWLSGQQSSVHDHGDSHCCMRVIQGVLTNTDFEPAVAMSSPAAIPFRAFEIYPGDIVARQGSQIHQVVNEQPFPGVTLHVYSPPLSSGRIVYESPA